MHSDFEDQKKVRDLFEFKEKRMQEEIDRLNAAKMLDLEEQIMLRTDSQKMKNQHTDNKKAFEDLSAKYNALVESF